MAHRHPGKYRSRTPRGKIVYKTRPIHKHSTKKLVYKRIHDTATVADKALKIFEAINYVSNNDRESLNGMIQMAMSYLVPVYGQVRATAMMCDAARNRDFPHILRQWIKLAGS